MQIICALQTQSNLKNNRDYELLQEFASPINNFGNLRRSHDNCLVSSDNLACIPFLGLFITDLKMNNEREKHHCYVRNTNNNDNDNDSNNDNVDNDQNDNFMRCNKGPFELIPWWKFGMAAKIMTPLMTFLKREKYQFELNPEIYNKLFN